MIAGSVAYATGARDLIFLLVWFLAYLPLVWVVLLIATRYFPPTLNLGDNGLMTITRIQKPKR